MRRAYLAHPFPPPLQFSAVKKADVLSVLSHGGKIFQIIFESVNWFVQSCCFSWDYAFSHSSISNWLCMHLSMYEILTFYPEVSKFRVFLLIATPKCFSQQYIVGLKLLRFGMVAEKLTSERKIGKQLSVAKYFQVGPGAITWNQWTIYSATSFLEKCRKVVREIWFEKSGSRNLVREKWLTRKKGEIIS